MIQTAKGDNRLSGDGTEVLSSGFPRSCPFFVASLLCYQNVLSYRVNMVMLNSRSCSLVVRSQVVASSSNF